VLYLSGGSDRWGVSHAVFCTVEIEIDGHCAEPTK
jgi:hypothetical protein